MVHDGCCIVLALAFPSASQGRAAVACGRLVVAVASVGAATATVYPLKHVAPVVSLGVVYVLAVVVVSTFWGLVFGVGTAVLSAAAFNFFHLPPGGRFTLADGRNWVAPSVFVVVAVATGLVAELARTRGKHVGIVGIAVPATACDAKDNC